MTIRFAKFINGEEVLKIKASEIPSQLEYQEKYRNNLYCNEEGCSAKIELAHRQHIPYFRTWQNSKHSPDCIYYFQNNPQNNPKETGETILVAISEDHKKAALRYSSQKMKEDLGVVTKNARTHKTTDKNRGTSETQRMVPSVDPDAEAIVSAGKEPPIKNRSCDDDLTKDIGKPINIRGKVIGAIINQESQSIRFLFDTKSDVTVAILFYNSFREDQQAYEWVKEIGIYLNKGNTIAASCLGNCQQGRDGFDIQVYDKTSIVLDYKNLSAFMRDFG